MSLAFCEGRYCWFGLAFCDGEGVFTRGACGLGVFMRGVVVRGARIPPTAASAFSGRAAAEIAKSPAATIAMIFFRFMIVYEASYSACAFISSGNA